MSVLFQMIFIIYKFVIVYPIFVKGWGKRETGGAGRSSLISNKEKIIL